MRICKKISFSLALCFLFFCQNLNSTLVDIIEQCYFENMSNPAAATDSQYIDSTLINKIDRTLVANPNMDINDKNVYSVFNGTAHVPCSDFTILHWAIINNRISFFEHLLTLNADIKAKDSRGNTPIDYILDLENNDFIEILFDYIKKRADSDLIEFCNEKFKEFRGKNNISENLKKSKDSEKQSNKLNSSLSSSSSENCTAPVPVSCEYINNQKRLNSLGFIMTFPIYERFSEATRNVSPVALQNVAGVSYITRLNINNGSGQVKEIKAGDSLKNPKKRKPMPGTMHFKMSKKNN